MTSKRESCSYAKRNADESMRTSIHFMNSYDTCTETNGKSCNKILKNSKEALEKFQKRAEEASNVCGDHSLKYYLKAKHDCVATKKRMARRKIVGGYARPDVEAAWYRQNCPAKRSK